MTVRFIAAEVKVTPTKATSVLRLELVTAVLGLRFARTELLEIPFENYTLYTFYDVPDKLPPFGLSDHDTVAVQPFAFGIVLNAYVSPVALNTTSPKLNI